MRAWILSLALALCSALAVAGDFCVQVCDDSTYGTSHYSLVRLSSDGRQVICAGPDSASCSRFTDSNCQTLGSGSSSPVSGRGQTCPYVDDIRKASSSVCASGYAALITQPAVFIAECRQKGDWTCMQSCRDKGNYLMVRANGLFYQQGSAVQCMGFNTTKCSWVGLTGSAGI